MRTTAFRSFVFLVLGMCPAGIATAAFGEAVVGNEYEDLNPSRDLVDVPVTVSRIGAHGDFTRGITPEIGGRKLPAQVDILRRADDGSIRHALVSFVLPKLLSDARVKIDWLDEAPPAPPSFRWGFDRSDFAVKLILRTENGEVLTSDLGGILGEDWSASGRIKVLHDGPVMKELEIHDVPVDTSRRGDSHIEVFWRLRAFTGARSVRVAAIVERCKARKKGLKEPVQCKFQSVELRYRDRTLYREGAYDHLDQTRFRILVWTHGPLETIHRRPNYAYWVKGKFVPRYRFTGRPSPAEIDQIYARRTRDRNNQKRQQGILEPGIIHRHMPGTGGRWEMEPYPAWAVAYLLSGAPRTYEALLHADGNGAGAFYIHVRQAGAPGYNIFTVEQPPLDRGYRIPLYRLPDGSRPPVQPDHAHAPSLGYISYLLTGDRYYAEEISFWASFQMGEWPHKGLRWSGMDRSFAYGLRHVVDAAYILPDDHPLHGYFAEGVRRCLGEMHRELVRSGRRVHSPPGGVFRCSGRANWVNAKRCSAWQYAWVVWSLSNAADKGFLEARRVRDWAAEYIVGFYTSQDEFRAPDGTVCRYDPRDAMPYSTATEVLRTRVVAGPQGKKTIEVLSQEGRPLENYGEIWYYTKLNADNAYFDDGGLTTEPDPAGSWPLREKGWGHGMTWNAHRRQQERWWGWHRYGAWVGLVSAVEGGVTGAREAWKVMKSLAGRDGVYGYEMVPRVPEPGVQDR